MPGFSSWFTQHQAPAQVGTMECYPWSQMAIQNQRSNSNWRCYKLHPPHSLGGLCYSLRLEWRDLEGPKDAGVLASGAMSVAHEGMALLGKSGLVSGGTLGLKPCPLPKECTMSQWMNSLFSLIQWLQMLISDCSRDHHSSTLSTTPPSIPFVLSTQMMALLPSLPQSRTRLSFHSLFYSFSPNRLQDNTLSHLPLSSLGIAVHLCSILLH